MVRDASFMLAGATVCSTGKELKYFFDSAPDSAMLFYLGMQEMLDIPGVSGKWLAHRKTATLLDYKLPENNKTFVLFTSDDQTVRRNERVCILGFDLVSELRRFSQ